MRCKDLIRWLVCAAVLLFLYLHFIRNAGPQITRAPAGDGVAQAGDHLKVAPALRPEQYVDHTCKEKRNLYFLKVIKAGSTTVQNILWRFGHARNLSFMLFKDKYPYPDATLQHKLVTPSWLGKSQGQGHKRAHNIMAEHSVFNSSAIAETMAEDTVKVGIVRHPLPHLRSVLNFFKLKQKLSASNEASNTFDDFTAEFLQSPMMYAARNRLPVLQNTRNRIAFEFGYKLWGLQYPPEDFEQYLEFLTEQFEVMIILEQLHESLVLMRRQFCWRMKDILYLPLRTKELSKNIEDITDESEFLTELELQRAARDWSAIDAALYDFFCTRHWERVSAESSAFSAEVTWFGDVIAQTSTFCGFVCAAVYKLHADHPEVSMDSLNAVLDSQTTVDKSPWDRGFELTGKDCVKMALDPNVWRRVELIRQFPEICTDPNPGKDLVALAQSLRFDKVYCPRSKDEDFPYHILASKQAPLSSILLLVQTVQGKGSGAALNATLPSP